MRLGQHFHLTYCTNVHPGNDWEQTFSELKGYLPKIREELGPEKLGVGLRLSNKASEELGLGKMLYEFKDWLNSNKLYVFTMNGFPYGNFHNEAVKDQVHAPDWLTDEREEYTLRLFKQLSVLLPKGMDGGISTSPVSYKHWFSTNEEQKNALQKGAERMARLAFELYKIEQRTGQYLHLDVEPEPDGLLENSGEVISFFKEYLDPASELVFGSEIEDANQLIRKYVTLCYDTCHFALAYEKPEEAMQKFKKEGIRIGKAQLSSALKIEWQDDSSDRIWEELSKFNEPVYLHQTTQIKNGKVFTYNDLPEFLERREPFDEIRAHFHVPIFLGQYGLLASTQDHLVNALQVLKREGLTNHLEIETYTMDVLPVKHRASLKDSIVKEMNWVIDQVNG